ncbi:MAG: zinc ribbon domain-containing protein [Acidimicrobiales bacterium]|nr:zinc ribbon domain-containing protein [Acidimicrobiales bacterium]
MPFYEFRCRTCATTFTERRSMSESDAPATCPEGHTDTQRMLSVFATSGAAVGGPAPAGPAPAAAPCGAACACH